MHKLHITVMKQISYRKILRAQILQNTRSLFFFALCEVLGCSTPSRSPTLSALRGHKLWPDADLLIFVIDLSATFEPGSPLFGQHVNLSCEPVPIQRHIISGSQGLKSGMFVPDSHNMVQGPHVQMLFFMQVLIVLRILGV